MDRIEIGKWRYILDVGKQTSLGQVPKKGWEIA
jgi:hypothetical protein